MNFSGLNDKKRLFISHSSDLVSNMMQQPTCDDLKIADMVLIRVRAGVVHL